MIEHRPFLSLGAISNHWLKARLHFRHGDIGRASHTPLGPLFIWNDDEFAPHSGFDLHGHRDVEIVTWVRSGAITHEDDAGNRARLTAGCVQVMSAGAGVHHAERNAESERARLFQIWLHPRQSGGVGQWSRQCCASGRREGRFVTLASGDREDVRAGALAINADARIRVATLRGGTTLLHALPPPGAAYLVTEHGCLDIGAVRIGPRDGALISDETAISLMAHDDTDVFMVELLAPAHLA